MYDKPPNQYDKPPNHYNNRCNKPPNHQPPGEQRRGDVVQLWQRRKQQSVRLLIETRTDKFPQVLKISIFNIQTRKDPISSNIEIIHTIEYWDQDRFNCLKYWEFSEQWILRAGHIQFPQILRIFILNIENRTPLVPSLLRRILRLRRLFTVAVQPI